MNEEKTLLNATLVFPVTEDGKVLMAMKAKKIGAGCWNGYGGGIEAGEDPKIAAVRELKEESGLVASPDDLKKISVVDFHNTKNDGTVFVCRVHVYLVNSWQGEARETKEMLSPTWFDVSELPFDQMMPGDRVWLQPALSGKKVVATAHYGPFQKELLKPVVLQEVMELV